MHYCFLLGPTSFVEKNADHVNTETNIAPVGSSSQGHKEWVETLDTTWAEALPFVPGQRYHSDGKLLL